MNQDLFPMLSPGDKIYALSGLEAIKRAPTIVVSDSEEERFEKLIHYANDSIRKTAMRSFRQYAFEMDGLPHAFLVVLDRNPSFFAQAVSDSDKEVFSKNQTVDAVYFGQIDDLYAQPNSGLTDGFICSENMHPYAPTGDAIFRRLKQAMNLSAMVGLDGSAFDPQPIDLVKARGSYGKNPKP